MSVYFVIHMEKQLRFFFFPPLFNLRSRKSTASGLPDLSRECVLVVWREESFSRCLFCVIVIFILVKAVTK